MFLPFRGLDDAKVTAISECGDTLMLGGRTGNRGWPTYSRRDKVT